MTANNRKAALQLVLAHEGGFVFHPKDPGGATNKGVTQKVYDAFREAKGKDVRSVKLITSDEVVAVYDEQYMDRIRFDRLPAGIDYAMFDYAVNSGVKRAVMDAQRQLNQNANLYGILGKLNVDGVPGNATIAALCKAASHDEIGFIEAYCQRRGKFLRSLKTFKTFGKGWMRRVFGDIAEGSQDGDNGVVDYAVKMAREDLSYPLKQADLPTAIGNKPEEIAAKASEKQAGFVRTPEGIGAALAGAGVTGQTLFAAAERVRSHTDDAGVMGTLALAAFVVLILGGVALVVAKYVNHKKELA